MSYFDKLKKAILIDKNTIDRVQKYVKTKYPQNTYIDNKVIIKDALNRIVCQELKEFDLEEKKSVVDSIIHKAINEEDKHITKLDVVEICSNTLEIKGQSLNLLAKWIEENIDLDANEDINEFLKEVRGIDYLGEYKSVDKNEHQEELVTIPEVIIKGADGLREKVVSVLNNVTPNQAFKATKMTFLSMLIFACGLFYYNENIGMAEMNSNELKSAQISNAALAYDEYYEEVESESVDYDVLACHPFLPEYFDYIEIDNSKIKEYLKKRNSILTDDKYFYDIIKTSKEFNLNPLILFAITGQEQGFVPRGDEDASKIANNPFNVFVSWRHYNKNIKDSSEIASRTVINLAKGNQNDVNIFKWINRLYADDPEWYDGVQKLFWDMMKYCDVKVD